MPWSEQQRQAISVCGRNILVAAAAGSGKTSVLVERVIEKITNGLCDINEILVVTFTNAAASEMRERIAAAIAERLPDKAKERQLALLNAASISTLHSFCQKIIRENFHLIDLDPKFSLASQQEIDLLKMDVMEDLFERKYELDGGGDFLELTDSYGSERGDDNIYDIVLKLYEYAQSQPFPEKWLESLPDFFAPEGGDINKCEWLSIIKDETESALRICLMNAEKMKRKAAQMNMPNYEKTAGEDIEAIEKLLAVKDSWQKLYEEFGRLRFSRLSAPRKTPEETKEIFKNMREEVKKTLAGVKEDYFSQSPAEAEQDLPALYRQAKVLCGTALDFAAAFAEAKAEKSIVDFSDLEHFALKILAREDSSADNLLPSAAAEAMQKKYHEIMVDEYQDTNGVQEAILNLVASKEKRNLFLVGDVKQSIYKFRLAEPELFLQKYNSYPNRRDCVRIDLSQNFRSRREILDGVNFVFSQLMTQKAAEISYGEKEALYCGFPYPELSGNDIEAGQSTLKSPIELVLIAKNGENASGAKKEEKDEENLRGFCGEAKYIAARLQKLMHEAPLVFDKHTKSYRPIKWRDMVILLRSVQNKAQILAEALRQAGIPVYASIDTGYFQETEVRTMLSLLQIIDNPQQDIPLAAVLHSPIVNLSAEDLARVRLAKPGGNMYQALTAAASGDCSVKLKQELKLKAKKFVSDLNKWRDYARRHSAPELIWLLLNETGYYDYAGALPEGAVRQANLRALYDRAAAYEKTSFRGLFRFLRFVKKMQKMGNDLSIARSLGENEDVVRVMSIHKSKGLEFPVVVLADAGKQFNLKDAQNPVLLHKKSGLGMYVNDVENHVRYQTLPRQAVAKQIIREYKAEELRVLYVAMTRAREKLIITGSADTERFARQCCAVFDAPAANERALPDYVVTRARSYLDWLGTALARHADGRKLRECGGAESAALLRDPSVWQVSVVSAVEPAVREEAENADAKSILDTVKALKPLPPTEEKAAVEAYLNWSYPHKNAQLIPTKLSVTEIKRRNAQLDADEMSRYLYEDAAFKRPQFLQKASPLTPTEYGSLIHAAMQHIDIHGDLSDGGLKKQLENMADREIIAKEHLSRIYRRNIREFFFSDIGRRMRKAKSVQRELAFSRMISARAKELHYESADKDDFIFVQGVIDVLFEEDDGFVLLDYKTDSCGADEAKEKYGVQINLYAEAAEDIMRRPVKEKYLYLFHRAQLIKM